jgi:aldose 1-epimerase
MSANMRHPTGKETHNDQTPATLTSRHFGDLPDGRPVTLYSFIGANGLCVSVMDYGATVVSISLRDDNLHPRDMVLGYDCLEPYLAEGNPYFGATCGRYANRIANARFTLDGTDYRLTANDGPHSLHGGVTGFDKRLWDAEILPGPALRLSYLSPDGEEGYPGNLKVSVTYSVTRNNTCNILFEAVTDKTTPVSLTNHSYFNLGDGDDILDHELQIDATAYTPVDEDLIPTGEIRRLSDATALDFRRPVRIGERIAEVSGGYDHNFVLRGLRQPSRRVARVTHRKSGRTLTVDTSLPGLQFYSGNFLDGSQVGKGGTRYGKHAGFCLEPQFFPDSPNHPEFPNAILRPGEVYRESIAYGFI